MFSPPPVPVALDIGHRHGTAGAIAATWRQAGVTSVLLHRSGLKFIADQSPELINLAVLADGVMARLRAMGVYARMVRAIEPLPAPASTPFRGPELRAAASVAGLAHRLLVGTQERLTGTRPARQRIPGQRRRRGAS